MAVLVEAMSLIVRLDAINEQYVGGLEAFIAGVHSATVCMDGELLRVGFLSLSEADANIHRLEAGGLQYLEGGAPRDMILVDQLRGPSAPCDWLEVGEMQIGPGQSVMAARLVDSEIGTLFTPEGWRYEHSHSKALGLGGRQ